jgi:hypothetical protein
MDTSEITEDELARIGREVDEQLAALRAVETGGEALVRGGRTSGRLAAPAQVAVIERESGQPFESFWARYLRHARRDLCLPGGVLHEQWKRWRDLESKAAVRVSYGWLAAMGIPTASLAPLAIAATVFLLNASATIGVAAICEGCAEEEEARARALERHAEETFGPEPR